jgi:hypothetical protein
MPLGACQCVPRRPQAAAFNGEGFKLKQSKVRRGRFWSKPCRHLPAGPGHRPVALPALAHGAVDSVGPSRLAPLSTGLSRATGALLPVALAGPTRSGPGARPVTVGHCRLVVLKAGAWRYSTKRPLALSRLNRREVACTGESLEW